MSIKHTQVVERDTLNRAFVSKSATGTQIMAGSLRLLGGLTIDGITTINSLTAGTLTVDSINASGTVTATTFSGSGASLTNVPATSLTGTINVARMPTNMLRTELAQTITTDKTFSTAANLYFAGGTTYRIDTSGAGHLSALNVVGTTSSKKLSFGSGQYAAPSDTSVGTKITLWDDSYQIGVETSGIWYDAKEDHKFYTNGYTATRTLRANISSAGASFYNDVNVSEDLEVQGEVKFGGANEFPDPLLASRSVTAFADANGTVLFDSVQGPSGIAVHGSLKMTASAANAYVVHDASFPVSPGEWVTLSSYLFSTTSGKSAQLHIQWEGSATTHTSHSFTAPTAWSRESVTGQAPATATSCRIRIDNDGGTGAVMYFAAFQVERGRGLTPFKPYVGGYGGAVLYDNHVKLGLKGEIVSSHNHKDIFKDHGNGNVTLNAAGSAAAGDLYLGYQNTRNVFLSSNLTTDASVLIASTAGKLYYEGSDIDALYFKSTGGTVSGVTTFSVNTVVNGNLGVKQAAPAYPLDVTGDARITGAIQSPGITSFLNGSNAQGIKVGNLVISNSYSNSAPTNGLYVQGDVSAKAKLSVVGDTSISGSFQVGSGTAANDLTVISGGALNWRNTLYSNTAGKVSINQTTNSEHPLHIKSNGSYMGVNIQATADTDVNGLSFERSNGYYNWHIARSGVAAADLVFYGGNTTSMSALTERFRIKNGGNIVVPGTVEFPDASNYWLSTAGNWGLYFDTLENSLRFRGAGNDKVIIDLDNGNSFIGGTLDVAGTGDFAGTVSMPSAIIDAADGNGIRYWGSTSYSSYMSESSDATYGGKLSWVVNDDYNMYFKMSSNNRGFAFMNGGVNAQIEGNGRVNSKVGFRADKFEMAYNETEDSLDFIYHG